MKQITFLDLFYLHKEFENLVKDSRLETFYFEDDFFQIKFYKKGNGNIFLLNKVGKFIYFDNKKLSLNKNENPKSFILFLRKLLKNSFVQKFEIIENERIFHFEISVKENEEIKIYNLFIELFGEGNIILTNDKKKILNALHLKKYKNKSILKNDIYTFEEKSLTMFNIEKNIKLLNDEIMKNQDLGIGKFLALNLNLGGKYSNELIFRLKLDPNLELSKIDKILLKEILKIINEFTNSNLEPVIYLKDDKPVEFSPFLLEHLITKEDYFKKKNILFNLNYKKTESFNDSLKLYFQQFIILEDKREKKFLEELSKYEKILNKQKSQKDKILRDVEELTEKGNLIYENYEIINNLLNKIKNLKENNKSWKEIEKIIFEKEQFKKIIKKLDYKNNKIILNL